MSELERRFVAGFQFRAVASGSVEDRAGRSVGSIIGTAVPYGTRSQIAGLFNETFRLDRSASLPWSRTVSTIAPGRSPDLVAGSR
ncbi:MAG: hypothetical protein OXQ29_08435 [Rhodospirillaceae bacterium]|nr:hypothetical protein [Rhodospirillaceae bacterium]